MTDRTQLGGRHRRTIVVTVALSAALLIISTLAFALAGQIGWQHLVESYTFTNLVIGAALVGAAVPPLWCTHNLVGPLLGGAGLAHLVSAAATAAAIVGLADGWSATLIATLTTFSTGCWQLGLPLLFPLALLVFPDGRLPGRHWWIVGWLIVAAGAFQMVTGVLSDGSSFSDVQAATSVVSVGLQLSEPVIAAAGMASTAAYLLAITALVVRAVRGDERTRRQLMWLLLAVIIATVLNLQRLVSGDGPILLLLSVLLVPAAMAVAIVRHELFDIRLVLSRTLLYGSSIAVIIALFAGLVAAITRVLPTDVDREVAIGAAIVVAVMFTPVRLLLQRMIDRAFYGTRSDPARAAQQIGEGLRHQDDLSAVLDQIRTALRLSYVGLRREPDGLELAAAGPVDTERTVELELVNHDQRVGTLIIGLRRGERQLHRIDRRALDLIATPLALALDAMRLAEQVSRARTAIVEATAVERIRLQRELHDGVGANLTSATFLADAASNLIATDPVQAGRLLGEVRAELRGVSDDVRRVVYGLRPIELEDAGLLVAIRQQVAALPTDADRRLQIEVHGSGELPPLSPAAELAAYRIVSEAVANVLRHSDAQRCEIVVAAEAGLVVQVSDDGTEPARWVPGVGLRSIVTRAEELGGTASAGPTGHGWRVTAHLPVSR